MTSSLTSLVIGISLACTCIECRAEELAAAAPSQRGLVLREALQGADRIELTPNDPVPRKKPTVIITGADKIAALIQTLDFLDPKDGWSKDGCLGEYTLRFFNADKELVKLSHHHGVSLRWYDGKWRGDSIFTQAAAAAWPKWFNDNGVPAFEQARLAKLAERELERKKSDRFLEGFLKPFSDDARKAYKDIMDDKEHKLADNNHEKSRLFLAACGQPYDAGLAICRALGPLVDLPDDARKCASSHEKWVVEAFALIDEGVQASVFESALKERGADLGAAQLFFDSNFHRDLPRPARDFIAPKMLRAVIERDRAEHALRAIESLDDFASVSVNEMLREIAAGKIIPSSLEPPSDRNFEVRCFAVLSLARRGDPAAHGLIESLSMVTSAFDRSALAVARCYLGERGAIRAEHFKVDSLPLGYVRLAALERQGDKEALDLIITAGFDSSWPLPDAAVRVVQRMTGKVWLPLGSPERPSNYCDEIRAWWKTAKAGWQPPRP